MNVHDLLYYHLQRGKLEKDSQKHQSTIGRRKIQVRAPSSRRRSGADPSAPSRRCENVAPPCFPAQSARNLQSRRADGLYCSVGTRLSMFGIAYVCISRESIGMHK